MVDGSVVPRAAGTLLANLFLHYAFDAWMSRNYPHIPFERYADELARAAGTEERTAEAL